MASIDVWRQWAAERAMRFHPSREALAQALRAVMIQLPLPAGASFGWTGSFGGLVCFGFRVAPNAAAPATDVAALRVPDVDFPATRLEPSDYTLHGPGLPINPEFDLLWCMTGAHPGFARDVVSPAMQALLRGRADDFSVLLERDTVVLSATALEEPTDVDGYLHLLRRLIDVIPGPVLAAVRRPAQLPVPQPWRQPPMQLAARPSSAMSGSWAVWAATRGWLYYPNAREIAERYNHGPAPTGRFTQGFAGRFGDLPCFGWQWALPGATPRQVLCVRRPGEQMAAVRVTQDDALLSALVGSGDIEVGDEAFDAKWRVTSPEPDAARVLLGPSVWRVFDGPRPPFSQLWLERDVAAVIVDGVVPQHLVDVYLRLLHDVLSAVGQR